MPDPLLETKFYRPRPRAGLIRRPRLSERLDRGTSATLMLVSAPAGFGKTTLLADWLAMAPAGAADEGALAWLSLDRGDNSSAVFWTYVIAALQTVEPSLGANERALLASTQPPQIDVVLTTLLNDLGSIETDIVLVLDDYHLIEAAEIHDAMAFLLDHMPPRLHLVIASRADPAVPLARLRARRELVEIRAADLRFTADEAAAYLNGVMGLMLTASDVMALEDRTEGWIAALQLAALSIQGRDDATDFIAGFAGDDRYIVDYLVEEVLQRQPAEVSDFLLQTSILARLSGPLCDAVTGTSGSRDMIDRLDRGNLFVVPLDDRRQWYRYHHLFGDVLRARLSEEPSDLVHVLHRRASDWYAENGEPAEAIAHALAGGHFERAADLFESALTTMRKERQESKLLGWLQLLPDEVVRSRPVLSNSYAGALLATGVVDGVERRLQDAERGLEATEATEAHAAIVDEVEFRRVPAGVAVHRAGLSLMTGDVVGTVAHAQRALTLLEDDDHLGRGAATALLGLASWVSGDLLTACDAYAGCLESMRRAGHVSDLLGCSIALADLQTTLGRLRDATRTFERALQLIPSAGPTIRGTADMYVGLSALRREQDDLPAAAQLLAQSDALGDHMGLPQNRYRWRVAMARVREAEGDLAAAVALLDDAERVYVGDFSPNVRPVPALRARLWIEQGRVEEALDWVREAGLSAADDASYLREYELITVAAVLLAAHEAGHPGDPLAGAAQLLDRLAEAAEAGHRTGSLIEILVLQALVHRAQGDVSGALVPLERALLAAEPEGYVRVFVDRGAAMASLLEGAPKRGIAPIYVGRLLAALGEPAARGPARHDLIDPLSQREQEVLRLLGTDLGGPEIARHLVVSLNTVRTHTKNIYAKLGVNNRRAAVRRAAELDL
ncbi:LuxR C-terminal-related transcriptional regulator [soil metagenome]